MAILKMGMAATLTDRSRAVAMVAARTEKNAMMGTTTTETGVLMVAQRLVAVMASFEIFGSSVTMATMCPAMAVMNAVLTRKTRLDWLPLSSSRLLEDVAEYVLYPMRPGSPTYQGSLYAR